MSKLSLSAAGLVLLASCVTAADADPRAAADGLRVGAAAVEIPADDGMVIGGGIHPGRAQGQEGQFRAVAVVLEAPGPGPPTKLALVACDVLFVTRDLIDPVVEEIGTACGIPPTHILVHATHTHHAPSTAAVHGYGRDEVFCRALQRAVVRAVRTAHDRLADAEFSFWLGEESSVGQNSRQLLSDGTVYWVGPRDDFVRPTGPFDPELPVLAFHARRDRRLQALIFNHSTHTIGTRRPGVRSPAFYGLAAQELESELGGTVCFLQGAAGSTHNLTLKADEMVLRMKAAVRNALGRARPRPVTRLAALKSRFAFKVRTFDEAREDQAVAAYCKKRIPAGADGVIEVFRQQRQTLAPQQGRERATWVQALRVGDVAFVGVPAELFTKLGQDIKRRSPFRYTYVAELANDWIGYLPDQAAFALGGYQTWTGLHCPAAPGTGEAVVDEAVRLLEELAK
jgi:hypothetical protein